MISSVVLVTLNELTSPGTSGYSRRKWKASNYTTVTYSTVHALTIHQFCGSSRCDSGNSALVVGEFGKGKGNTVLGLQTQNEQLSIVLTYCHHYGPSHRAWKLRRQSYDTDGVSQATLWLCDCYSVVSCTSPNIHTTLVSPSTVGYPVPSHSGS